MQISSDHEIEMEEDDELQLPDDKLVYFFIYFFSNDILK
jgi:hypothetical protein